MFGVRVFDVFRVFNVFRCGLAGGLVDGLEGGQSIDFSPQHATVRENAHNFDQDRSNSLPKTMRSDWDKTKLNQQSMAII